MTDLPYVGQTTQDLAARLDQHDAGIKREVKQLFARIEVVAEDFGDLGVKDKLRLAEQAVIDDLGGKSALSNDINAISKERGRLRKSFANLCD